MAGAHPGARDALAVSPRLRPGQAGAELAVRPRSGERSPAILDRLHEEFGETVGLMMIRDLHYLCVVELPTCSSWSSQASTPLPYRVLSGRWVISALSQAARFCS